jgi:hypothetical protein
MTGADELTVSAVGRIYTPRSCLLANSLLDFANPAVYSATPSSAATAQTVEEGSAE